MKKIRIKLNKTPVIPASDTPDSMAELASGMADDFNNILTTVMGACSLIDKDEATNSELLHYVSLIRKSAERAASLSDKLMRVSNSPDQLHGNAGKIQPDSVSVATSVGDKKAIHDIVQSNKKTDGATS
ncbi:MAG: histidine kinase dimerization/phospho-acceptor domain-containing protein [Desulfuromonadaceae bacterium]|nr:histidine kinase dimerization/phospho-acceptor domain-containing protein [Desulfuromonadaceae bacterium]